MAHKWVGFLIFVYVIAMIAGSISTGADMFQNPDVTNPVQGVQSYAIAIYQADFVTLANPVVHWQFFQNLFKIMILDFPVFNSGPWIVLRWVILAPIIAMAVYGVASAFFGLFQRQV